MFHRYLSHKGWKTNLKNLMEAGTMNDYFSVQDNVPVKSLRLAYMNSFQNLVQYEEGYQLREEGPDSYVIYYKKIENSIRLKWKEKSTAKLLPAKRNNLTQCLPRRLKNSLGKTTVYVIPASEVKSANILESVSKIFLIPYKVETYFVSFSPI